MLHVQCQQHLFALFASSQIRDDRSQQVFFAQMTLCAMRYDLNYHPWGLTALSRQVRSYLVTNEFKMNFSYPDDFVVDSTPSVLKESISATNIFDPC